MSRQPSLFDAVPLDAPRRGAGGVRQSFEDFHRNNPTVYVKLRDLALQAQRNGLRSFGVKALIERLRWDPALRTDGRPFKLNHTAAYARLLFEQEPGLRGCFRLRECPP